MQSQEMQKYLLAVTDRLSGQRLSICPAESGTVPLPPEAALAAEHLRYVWEVMHELDCPEPSDFVMERLYRKVLTQADSSELDENELDLVVGAGKPQEPPPGEE
jgi:hypothetical protein